MGYKSLNLCLKVKKLTLKPLIYQITYCLKTNTRWIKSSVAKKGAWAFIATEECLSNSTRCYSSEYQYDSVQVTSSRYFTQSCKGQLSVLGLLTTVPCRLDDRILFGEVREI